jgi:hypothetical protein
MKKIYKAILITFFSINIYSQGYEFGIIHNSNFNFSIVAIPDFTSSGNTDISDIGFALMLPTGNSDIIGVSQFFTRTWSVTEVPASTLSTLGLGDGTRDAFVFNLPPGQTILSHTNGEQIELVNFDISNNPQSGYLEILSNNDSIAIGLGSTVDSFYNSNIDNTITEDYFLGLVSGQENFPFATLSINDAINEDTQEITIYPNPTTSYFNIISDLEIDLVELFDLTGKMVLSSKDTTKIDITDLANGVYLSKIYYKNTYTSLKIIKE